MTRINSSDKTKRTSVFRKMLNVPKTKRIKKRHSIFNKIKTNYKSFKEKITNLKKDTIESYTDTEKQTAGKDIADIIKPITEDMGDTTTLTTEDFKKGFFKSLCGSSLDDEKNPEVFFFQNHELSIRKEGLKDDYIKDIATHLQDDIIKNSFIAEFPTVGGIQQGELIATYLLDINEKITQGKADVKYEKPTSKSNTVSPERQKILDMMKQANEQLIQHKKDIETVEQSLNKISEKKTHLDISATKNIKLKDQMAKLHADNKAVNKTTQDGLQKIITTVLSYSDTLTNGIKDNINDVKNIDNIIDEAYQKYEADNQKLQHEISTYLVTPFSEKDYKEDAKATNDIIDNFIKNFTTHQTHTNSLLKLTQEMRTLANIENTAHPSPENQERLDKFIQEEAKIQQRLTDIDTTLKALEEKQKDLQTLSQEEALKQHIIAESEKLADMFDASDTSQERTTPQTIIDAFHDNLDEALKNILDDAEKTQNDAGKTQALQNAVDAIQNILPPLAFLGLMLGLDNYNNQIDASIFKNNNIETLIAQRINLQKHLTNSSNTIDFKTLPVGQTHTLFASNDKNHKAINITKTGTDITISTHDFHDATKVETYKLDTTQIPDAQNYLNEILESEKTTYPNFSDINTTLDKFTKEYETPKNATIPLSQEIIDKIHSNLYENDSIIESYWIAIHETDTTNKVKINEKFKKLFPTKAIYDSFYQDTKKDGQPLTTLAMQYLAYRKWGTLDQGNILALKTLHAGMRSLSKPNDHSTNHITLSDIFKDDGDAILLDFNNNPTARTAGEAHYTGALIRKNADNDYTITTINTSNQDENGNERKYDKVYTLTNNIKKIIEDIYAKSTRGKNSDPENAIPKTNLRDIENILKDAGINPALTEEQTQQTELRCGIEVVNRAINYLPKLAEANIKRKEILSNTHNKFEMTIEENSNNITVPPKFIFDRYINPLIEADSTSSTEEIKKIFKCTESQKALFGNDADCDANYIKAYITSYQKTNPITAIALLDYQNAEKYKPLMESMQAGGRVHAQRETLFSNEPTSFIFKTDDANHTIMTIMPQEDNKYEIIFVNSQTPKEREIFTINDDKKEDVQNLVKNLTNYSERLMFDRNNPNTFPPNARPNLTTLKENDYLTRKNNIPLDEGISYLDNINNYIKGTQTP